MKTILNLTLPIKTISEANWQGHWRVRHKRSVDQKKSLRLVLDAMYSDVEVPLPCVIHMTRLSKMKLDSDNLPSSMKYLRDALAEWIVDREGKLKAGKADGDERIEWVYNQSSSSTVGVNIVVSGG